MRLADGSVFSLGGRPASLVLAVSLLVWWLIAPLAGRFAVAEEASPFTGLGLPTIAVTISNGAFEGVPDRLPAGRYVLAVTNEQDDVPDDTAGAAFMRLPDDVSFDEFTSLVDDDASSWPAAWYGETILAGGAYADLGQTAFAVIDLTAGAWVLWSEALGSAQDPESIVVAGSFPQELPDPDTDVAVDLSDFAFAFSAPLQSGPQIIEVANTGQQPHFVFMGSVPAGTTVAEAQAAFASYWDEESAAPASFSFAETPELVGTGDQSTGTTAWYAIDLPAGTIVVACFVIDQESGEPHAMLGMTEILEVR